jgi:hypothetical protein
MAHELPMTAAGIYWKSTRPVYRSMEVAISCVEEGLTVEGRAIEEAWMRRELLD